MVLRCAAARRRAGPAERHAGRRPAWSRRSARVQRV